MKLSQYNLVIESEKEVIVYNLKNLSGFKVKKDSEEYERLIKIFNSDKIISDGMVNTLYSKGFIVDDNVNEFEEVRQKVNQILNKEKRYIEIFLHVTNNCNFKCVYCFKEANIEYFSDENWENLFKFIKKQFDDDKLDKVKLYFYGGEPLLRAEKIITFMDRMNTLCSEYDDKKIEYNIISNGYLLTHTLYDRLSSIGGLKYIQITLDGFAEQHNKTRPLVDGSGTWNKIIEHLKYINTIDDGVQVIIRTNFNDSNKDILIDFKKWLEQTFTNKKFIFDFNPVIAISSHVDKNTTIDRYSEETQDIEDELNGEVDFLMESLTQLTCNYSSRYGHLTILPNGNISQCLEAYKGTIVGYLGDGEVVYTEDIDSWLNRLEKEDCKTCIAYPLCCAKACIVENKCDMVHKTLHVQVEKIKKGKINLF